MYTGNHYCVSYEDEMDPSLTTKEDRFLTVL